MITVIARSVDDNLRKLLNSGPEDSRIVLAALAKRGFTPKQVRRARERLRVAVTRSGNRSAMRSTWALPAAVETVVGMNAHKGDALTFDDMAENACAPFTEAEVDRIERRVRSFMARGMSTEAGAALAQRLVIERDRPGSRQQSCIECESLEGSTCCAGAAGFTPGPKSFAILWVCLSSRRQPWD